MRRHGRTKAGTERYFCPVCTRASIIHRTDTHLRDHFVAWLTGVQNKTAIARRYGMTRQALSYEFRRFFRANPDGMAPLGYKARMLIVDAKFIHGDELCALIAVDEHDRIFWQFATDECYGTWYGFLVRFAAPDIVVADGHKGMAHFVKRHWPHTAFQRCHFHMVSLVIHYLSRNPKETAGKDILELMYRLKYVHTHEERDRWKLLHRIWEKQYERMLNEKNALGEYTHRKLRSVRGIIRRALLDLFTYLDYPGCPNTTNLVEGWVNTALAEGLRRHRGLRLSQKKTLVAIILSHLRREKPSPTFTGKNTPIFP